MSRNACLNCRGGNLHAFLDLGRQPNGNNFPTDAEKGEELSFPLVMLVCSDCWQVQIDELPPQEFLFQDHPYITGVNVPVVRHFQALVTHVIAKLGLARNDLAIDLGCNDGTLLEIFAEHGLRVLGVDPSKRTGELARQRGITVLRTFWNSQTGGTLRSLNLEPQIITAASVFYHVPDLHDFLDGLVEIMGQNTTFIVQGVDLRHLIENNEFDHFYHEHSCIHSVMSLRRLFEEHGLRLQDVEFSDIHGGSFILYVYRRDNSKATSASVEAAIAAEQAAGLDRLSTYHHFASRTHDSKKALHTLLVRLKSEGKSVYGLGAPVKGSTRMNFCDIGPDLVTKVTEVNEFKIGRVTPGTHIAVVDERALADHPDYYLVLAWNFVDYLREKYDAYLRSGGRFIVPVPELRIIGPTGDDTAGCPPADSCHIAPELPQSASHHRQISLEVTRSGAPTLAQ